MQTITKDGKIICRTTVDYPLEAVREMKKAGYKIKSEDKNNEKENDTRRD